MVIIPEYEAQLEAEAERRAAPSATARPRRLRSAHSFAAAMVVGGLLLTGTAYAARDSWLSSLGWGPGPERATATTTEPAEAQTGPFAVLRRPQSENDRSEDVRRGLRSIGSQPQGVNLDYVRRLGSTPDGGAILAFTAERAEWAGQTTATQAVCLGVGGGRLPFGGTARCEPADIARRRGVRTQYSFRGSVPEGEAWNPQVGTEVGLVPDGVVAIELGHERTPVRDNHYVLTGRSMDPGAGPRVRWILADGTSRPAGH